MVGEFILDTNGGEYVFWRYTIYADISVFTGMFSNAVYLLIAQGQSYML
jgi:hypothetical protein